jgi:hypothetical protein
MVFGCNELYAAAFAGDFTPLPGFLPFVSTRSAAKAGFRPRRWHLVICTATLARFLTIIIMQ